MQLYKENVCINCQQFALILFSICKRFAQKAITDLISLTGNFANPDRM